MYLNKKEPGYDKDDIMYWRKANQIHNFFVQEVQDGEDDGEEYPVDISNLQELAERCEMITTEYKKPNNKEKAIKTAKMLLPTTSGSFFGSTDYDEYYFEQIERTLLELEKIIKEVKKTKNNKDIKFTYYASW